MKKFMLFVLLLPVFANAQTSWAEYKFATQGYAKVLDNSASMMEGYKVEKEQPKQVSFGTLTFCRLIAIDDDKVVCGIIILKSATGAPHYLGIPLPDSAKEILNQSLKEYESLFPGSKGGLSEEGANLLFTLCAALQVARK